jgi:(E)-4-hydroxy-3-methylbut-2-enyl-diphosphate synthase
MQEELNACYPLHLGVTEAGDGEDGRIKSAIGIGSLLEDGIGDTIRVSLTEDPEFEVPVCRDIVKRYETRSSVSEIPEIEKLPYDPFAYRRRETRTVSNIGNGHVPVVIADMMKYENISPKDLVSIGYKYDEVTDKWNISDAAADFVYTGKKELGFKLPGTLKVIVDQEAWLKAEDREKYYPVFKFNDYYNSIEPKSASLNFVIMDVSDTSQWKGMVEMLLEDKTAIPCLGSSAAPTMMFVRRFIMEMMLAGLKSPLVLCTESSLGSIDEQLIHFSTETGALLLDGMGDGIWLWNNEAELTNTKVSGRTYLEVRNNSQFLNNTAFSILQATRTRISKTEYISCPSCGRTLFDLQETTAKIRGFTHHLKGVKIAIMGCIVNGPGEMADADFGYVGSGVGKITLYKGREIMKRNVDSEIAVQELIQLLKESEAWVEP